MQDGYRSVAGEGTHEIEIKKSRFLTTIAPAAGEQEAQAVIARLRAAHPGANHTCFAYVIGPGGGVRKSSDDGEPGGTAGVPMLQMLLRREVCDVVAVVTRYFGGIQLGAGGLIRAYGGAVGQALDALGTIALRRLRRVTVTVDHPRAGRLENDLRATGHTVRQVTYGEHVVIELAVAEDELAALTDWLADATAGEAVLATGDVTYEQG